MGRMMNDVTKSRFENLSTATLFYSPPLGRPCESIEQRRYGKNYLFFASRTRNETLAIREVAPR